ncbi:MAG: ATP-binding protein [Limisphaerales bacterium]
MVRQTEQPRLADRRTNLHPLPGGEGRGEGEPASSNTAAEKLARRPSPLITFIVTDTGIGMTPEQLSNLFQAFTQADAGTSKKYGGTGLGLVLCRRFSQLMGGDVTVESEFGKGTTFTLTVPTVVSE